MHAIQSEEITFFTLPYIHKNLFLEIIFLLEFKHLFKIIKFTVSPCLLLEHYDCVRERGARRKIKARSGFTFCILHQAAMRVGFFSLSHCCLYPDLIIL